MKTLVNLVVGTFVGISCICKAQNIASQQTQVSVPAPTPYSIAAQDANSRVWQMTDCQISPSGEIITNTHSYTEVASGLNHQVNGQWVESKEDIDILPNGTAAATNGQHQAYFPGNIYDGQIELVTQEGLQLYSRPLALSYFDGNNTVIIAELTNSVGIVVGDNQVVYPNAFTDFKVDLRYTYIKAGFEQDIILRTQPPTPESLGLNPDTARLQIMTEFFSAPQPTIQSTELPAQAGVSLTDESLGFGSMQMIQGRAFLMGQDAQNAGALVSKHWLLVNGRQVLIEEVPVEAILEGLAALPLTAMNSNSSKNSHTASRHLTLPPNRMVVQNTSKNMMIAKADLPMQGFVLDYQMLGSLTTNFVFQGDTTYYVSGNDILTGTNIIEGGAVIKCNNGWLNLTLTAPAVLLTQTAPYRTAILTSTNDNSVGETISGSTGTPTVGGTYIQYNMNTSGSVSTWSNLRFIYAGEAIAQTSGGTSYTNLHTIQDCQFIDCTIAIYDSTYYNNNTLNQQLYNVLFSRCGTAVMNGSAFSYHGDMSITAQNMTADQVTNLLSVWSGDTYAMSSSHLTNSILTGVPHLIFFTDTSSSTTMQTNNCYVAGSGSGVYQSAGAGNYYLTNNSLRNIGTTNINATLLADLRIKTTYPPILYSNVTVSINTTLNPQAQRDTDMPDLGYHYDPIDYLVDRYTITNGLLTLTNGVAIASYNDSGIILSDGSAVVSIGSPLYPNWLVRYSSVQEQPIALGPGPASGFDFTPDYFTTALSGQFRFTKFACPAVGGTHLYDCNPGSPSGIYANLLVQDCEFWSGKNTVSGGTNTLVTLKNNLFARSTVLAGPIANYTNNSLVLSNNLFWITSVTLLPSVNANSNLWFVFNNSFDNCILTTVHGSSQEFTTNGYNAYIQCNQQLSPTNVNDKVLTSAFAYQTGPLGTFYQTNSSVLIDAGSTTANQAGLYHYTTQTNLVSGFEVPEATSPVDIGYHYIAVDANGNPLDYDSDGIPDYLEDANGNGLVDSGETDWQSATDFGLKIWITRPRTGSTIP